MKLKGMVLAGKVYTPKNMAEEHALQAFRFYNHSTSKPDHARASILEPSCGDGALVRAAIKHGADPSQITAVELDPEAPAPPGVEHHRDDFLFWATDQHFDICLGNPPWVGKVSKDLGSAYAKKVSKRFASYNAASDLCAAFFRRAAEVSDQISFIVTNTAWQGRTFRSGAKPLLLSREWAALWLHDPGARYTGLGVLPGTEPWPTNGASVHYIQVHLVRVNVERHSCWEGGMHYGHW